MRLMIMSAALGVLASGAASAAVKQVSEPKGVTVSIYDTGMAMVNELRSASMSQGENQLRIGGLPAEIDPSSASIGSITRKNPFDLLEQTYRYDLSGNEALFSSMVDQPVVFEHEGVRREGILLGGPIRSRFDQSEGRLPVRSRDGQELWLVGVEELSSVTFPFSREELAVKPELLWRVQSRSDGPENFRLSYRTGGLEWNATYELLLNPESSEADFNARVRIDNRSGGRFENARVRLLLTEKGMTVPIVTDGTASAEKRPALRYQYGATEPAFERSVASMAPMDVYELPQNVTLEDARPTYIQLVQAAAMPVRQFYVYDGVRFDRFQRNSRTDWNYGTEYHSVVQTHVEFENIDRYGLGINLPPGLCRLYKNRADGSIDMIGEEFLLPMSEGGKGYLRVGPARGLTGERVRTGYVEVKPHHIYEESFEIRLANDTKEKAAIKVVEHLYRWPDFQIVRADADFTETSEQTIEFEIDLQPGGRRTIHYTVRYNW